MSLGKSLAVVLAVLAVGTTLAGSARGDTLGNALLKGQSVFSGWPGEGLAGVWAHDYTPNGQYVPGTFTGVAVESDGRTANTESTDIDGDGRNEVLLGYNWAGSGNAGVWMQDVDGSSNPIGGTFSNIDQWSDGRAIDVAAADLGRGNGSVEVLLANSHYDDGGIRRSGLFAANVGSGGQISNFRQLLDLNANYLYSVGAGDVDNDGSTEVLLGEHRGTVDFDRLNGTQIELFLYRTGVAGIVGPAVSLGTFDGGANGGWLGLGVGDVDDDGLIEGVMIQTNWSGPSAAGIVRSQWFNVTGGSLSDVLGFHPDDYNRRMDPGVTGPTTLIPEPASLALLGVLGWLGAGRRRRGA